MVAGHMDTTARSSSSAADAHGVSPAHDIKRTRHWANIFWLIEFFPTGFFSLIKRTNEQHEHAIGQIIIFWLIGFFPTGFFSLIKRTNEVILAYTLLRLSSFSRCWALFPTAGFTHGVYRRGFNEAIGTVIYGVYLRTRGGVV
jgi:hypothetical protein